MISPAMTTNGMNSHQTSPEFHMTSMDNTDGHEIPRDNTQVQLEAIRQQQLDIQRQLDQLQHQQPQPSQQGQSPATPNGGQDYGGYLPSPMVPNMDGNFRLASHFNYGNPQDSLTPLTSPALNPYTARFHARSNSLSTLPSPAIHAYNPQNQIPIPYYQSPPSDPQMAEYLANLASLLDTNIQAGQESNQEQQFYSGNGSGGSGGSTIHTPASEQGNPLGQLNGSPAMLPSAKTSPQTMRKETKPGPGPHRANQAGRTRPSPMLRPTGRPNRMSTGPNGQPQNNHYASVPPSPLVGASMQGSSSSGGVNMRDCAPPPVSFPVEGAGSNISSTSGSLSPVDLTPAMNATPTPPSPNPQRQGANGQQGQSGFAPITPATLMQLGQPISTSSTNGSSSPRPRRSSGGNGGPQRVTSRDYYYSGGKDGNEEGSSSMRQSYAVPSLPSKGSSGRQQSGEGHKGVSNGKSILNTKTIEGLRTLKADSELTVDADITSSLY